MSQDTRSREIDSFESRLLFANQLQNVTNKIHATNNLDEIMLDLSLDICKLFDCDRLTLYALAKDRNVLHSRAKVGIHLNKDLVLPLNTQSIAGFVAIKQQVVRVADAYDTTELQTISPELHFFDKVDQAVSYRTRQMLAAPLINKANNQSVGVIQLLNTLSGLPFSTLAEQGLCQLCETLAIAFTQRIHQPLSICSKYQSLVVDSLITEAELDLAARWARRKELDIEQVLEDEYQVNLSAIGQALAKYYRVPYEPYLAHRSLPPKLASKLNLEQVERQKWIPLEEDRVGLTVLTTDPEHANDTGQIQKLFPYPGVFFRVTTKQEFARTVAQLLAG